MMVPYDVRNHFWIVAGDESRLWSSAVRTYVAPDAKDFTAWQAAGRLPTRIASEDELWDVLTAQAPDCLPDQDVAQVRFGQRLVSDIPPALHTLLFNQEN